jgi:glycerophosphoryl diester phosphodiesterase
MVTNIAHRGARSIAPENTIAAADKAFKAHADLWETDVAVTRDEHLILLHDPTLQRTTDVADVFPKRVHQMYTAFTLAEIRQLNTGVHFIKTDPFGQIKKGVVASETLKSFENERIPTLEEALMFTREKEWRVNLELKTLPADFRDFPVVQRVIELIGKLQIRPEQVIISSFNHSWLNQVKAAAPAFEIQALIGYSPSAPLDWGDFSFPVYNALSTRIDDAQIARAKRKKKGVNLFTVNETDEMVRFINAGVDGLITDYPQRLHYLLTTNQAN